MVRRTLVSSIAAAALLAGCAVLQDPYSPKITVDVNEIEVQADALLDFVEGKIDRLPGMVESALEDTTWLREFVDFTRPVRIAYAAALEQNSPRVTEIALRMKRRYKAIQELKGSGSIGETNRGLLELIHPENIETPEQTNEVQRVLAAENEDRKALYKELAMLNEDQHLSVTILERVYALKRLERAQPGEYFQLPQAGQEFDIFKASPQGRRLGTTCKPEAWVGIK